MSALQQVLRREAFIYRAQYFLIVGVALFGLLPLLAMVAISVISGTVSSDGDPTPEGYPPFTPPRLPMYALVALQIVLTIAAYPVPMRDRIGANHLVLLQWSGLLMAFTFANGFMTREREGSFWGLDWLGFISLGCVAALLLRAVAGGLGWLPRSWRYYLDEDGRVIDPQDVIREFPTQSWEWRFIASLDSRAAAARARRAAKR
ncbi:hypothetical protein NQ156_07230 [Microbacterium sp. zg.Y625]|uniref:hypothetical protein n=1 Tax=Microbacterium jiangjiandongii TaxID=3049071 RepID=UPI00214C95E3|nr:MULTISPECIES: hypothetical protein [unclassified Microbacterium]MCR2792852.1 hypothetical protein [Microbacterium sp. zg.Y625]WIM26824.1 hypothetical protein QNO14_07255 [Microbacterium sp. zg-Y625]